MAALRKAVIAALLVLGGCAATHAIGEADFDRVTAGMGQAEVRRVLGEPLYIESFPRLQQLAWNYEYIDLWGYYSTFTVVFNPEGRVIEKLAIRKVPSEM